jgi:hypothetical protein
MDPRPHVFALAAVACAIACQRQAPVTSEARSSHVCDSSPTGTGLSCSCSNIDDLGAPGCSLCNEAVRRPPEQDGGSTIVIKDKNPCKGRWLALPLEHRGPCLQTLSTLSPQARRDLGRTAVAKALAEFGPGFGLAINPRGQRAQCHLHVHIGRLRPNVPCSEVTRSVSSPDEVFAIATDQGVWVHAADGGYHVHESERPEDLLEMSGGCR